MYNLSLKEEWLNNKKFCHKLSDDEDEAVETVKQTQEAAERLTAQKSRCVKNLTS